MKDGTDAVVAAAESRAYDLHVAADAITRQTIVEHKVNGYELPFFPAPETY